MATAVAALHRWDNALADRAANWERAHPILLFWGVLVLVPLLLVLAVALFAAALVLPLSWLLGWAW